jgi:hypothetical protein
MNNFDMLTAADIAAKGNVLLNKENAVDPATLTTEDRLENLSILLAYKEMLDERFAERLKAFEDSIDIADFDGTYKVGNHKITFKVKELVSAKAIGLTNEKLQADYNIAKSIISVETKTIATLKKDKLEEAINAQIPEVLDAIRDGKLLFTKSQIKTSSVK